MKARFPALEASKFKFLILGAGRSGTSLLTGLIDAHPSLEVAFELGGHEYLRGKALEEMPGQVFYDRADSFINCCLRAAQASDRAQWGNKIITEQLAGLNRHNLHCQPPLDTLDLFLNEYLAPLKIIYLLRDGRACVESKLNRTSQSLQEACRKWLFSVRVYEFLQSRPNTLLLRYEDLLAQPAKTLQQVYQFLEVGRFDDFQSGTMSEKIPGEYRTTSIEAGRAGEFTEDHPSVEFIGDELRRCGYLSK